MLHRIFHVDLDAFFVSVEQSLDPSLAGKPVVVGGALGSRGVVACASYEARTYGLKAGMPLSQAYRLCPNAIFVQGLYSRYQEVSERFMAILSSYTPFLEPLGIDEAYMDMTGFESLYGSMEGIARTIKSRINKELGVVASVGIASSKVVAKVASDYGKPDGLVEVPPGEDAVFIAPLAVARMPGVGGRTQKVLQPLGIATVGQLASLSPVTLRRIFGAWGDMLYLWANGLDTSPVVPPGEAKSISRETTFAKDTLDREFLRGILRYLGERVGASLRRQGKLARCVTLKLRYSDFQTISRQLALKAPSSDDSVIFQSGDALFSKAIRERRDKVRLIGIGVQNLIQPVGQLSFLDFEYQRKQHLSEAMDAIRNKYGFTSIQRGLTYALRSALAEEDGHFLLKTPSLSR